MVYKDSYTDDITLIYPLLIPSLPTFWANIGVRSNIALYGKYFKTRYHIYSPPCFGDQAGPDGGGDLRWYHRYTFYTRGYKLAAYYYE